MREVGEGDPLRFTTRLLGWDAKRIHYFHEMYHATEGYLAATNELMSLHVSQETRRAAPMAPESRSSWRGWRRPTRPCRPRRTLARVDRPSRETDHAVEDGSHRCG